MYSWVEYFLFWLTGMENSDHTDRKEIRRPMNAFLIFCKRHRSMVREKNPHLDNRSVTRILGELWANLNDQEKTVYTDLAKQVFKEIFLFPCYLGLVFTSHNTGQLFLYSLR